MTSPAREAWNLRAGRLATGVRVATRARAARPAAISRRAREGRALEHRTTAAARAAPRSTKVRAAGSTRVAAVEVEAPTARRSAPVLVARVGLSGRFRPP